MLKKYLYIFAISMVPIIELRGAIPIGTGLGLDWLSCYIVCVIGNMVPVPFILLFIRAILNWMKGVEKFHFSDIAKWVERKAEKGSVKVQKYARFGLFAFVAIPLPGTGAWTGALIAAMLNMKFKHSIISIFLGVLTAGAIMTGASLLIKNGIDFGILRWIANSKA